MTDEQLSAIGRLAIQEHAQWRARNQAREALRKAIRNADMERLTELARDDWDDEDWAAWQALLDAVRRSQSRLNTCRAATRRAIARAVSQQEQGG